MRASAPDLRRTARRVKRRVRRRARRVERRVRRLGGRVLPRHGRVRRGGRSLRAAVVTSGRIALEHRQPCLVYRAREGYWVHRYPEGATVAASPRTVPSVRQLDERAYDYFFQEYVPRPGDTVVDVGAGYGTELHIFARLVGRTGRVYAIEAHPETYRWLERLRRANRARNVTLVFGAITDHAGFVSISDADRRRANTVVGAGGGEQVAGQTLDDFVRERGIERIDFLKMNIEGAERQAIRGMEDSTRLIANVCISCHDFLADRRGGDQAMRTKSEVRQFLLDHGYEVKERRADDARPWARDYLYGRRAPDLP